MKAIHALALLLILSLTAASSAQITQLAELTASDASTDATLGSSTAVSGDTVVVGAPQNCETTVGPGAAYVFVKPPTGWGNMTQTAKLTASNGQPGDCFGASVAISGDTILVGADNTTVQGNLSAGTVYVFVKPASGWTNMTETAQLNSSDEAQAGFFGERVAIQRNTAVVGASGEGDSQEGASYVFVEPTGGWVNMTETASLSPSNPTPQAYFGSSVAIYGNTIAVGAECAPSFKDFHIFCGPGTVYVFVEPPGGWVDANETAMLTRSDGQSGKYDPGLGDSVAMNDNTIVAAAPYASTGSDPRLSGKVYVFIEPSGGWTSMTQTAELYWDLWQNGGFGFSLAIQNNTIFVGGPGIPAQGVYSQGIAAVFVEPNGGWVDASKGNLGLTSPGALDFGNSVAVSGNALAIGAPGTTSNGAQYAGSAYIFGRTP